MSRTSPRKQSKNNGSSASETAKNVKSLPEYDEGSDFSSLNESPVKPNTDGRRTAKSPAGRALFAAKPATDTKDWIKGLSNDIMQEKTKKWNYDFKNDTPLSSAANDPSTSTKSYEALDERNVPEFYRSKTVASTVKTRRAEKIGAVSVTLKSPQKNVRKLEKVVEEETSPTKHQTTSSTFAAAVGGGGYSSPKKSAIKRKRPFPGLDKTPSKSKTSEKDEVDPKA